MKNYFYILTAVLIFFSCENRALHDGEEFKPRIIHEDTELSFDRIEIDGIEYLILEKDYNNPHEGFGFMAFRANVLMEKQDSVIAHLRTVSDMQTMIYARLFNVSEENARALRDSLYEQNLTTENYDFDELEKSRLSSQIKPGELDSIRRANEQSQD